MSNIQVVTDSLLCQNLFRMYYVTFYFLVLQELCKAVTAGTPAVVMTNEFGVVMECPFTAPDDQPDACSEYHLEVVNAESTGDVYAANTISPESEHQLRYVSTLPVPFHLSMGGGGQGDGRWE